MDEERFDAIVGLLYEAAMQPERWKPALLALSEAIGGTAGQVVFGDRQTLLPSFSSISGEQHEDANARYGEYFAAHDPRTAKVRESCAGLWMNDAEHFDETFVRHNETYQDFLIPFDYRWVIGTHFEAVDNAEAIYAVLRSPGQEAFGVQESNFLWADSGGSSRRAGAVQRWKHRGNRSRLRN